MSSDENLNNLNTKYNRLISDYKNLRDKHNLLKNALITEREKSKELESLYVENGIQSRKFLQEIESLNFRNDMLTKQVNNLRDELDHEKQSKLNKKPSSKIHSKPDEVDVIKEELINKIDECSKLHSHLSNLQLEYQMETNNFRSAINDLENQLKLVKSQSNTNELNIRKALANEIEERSALELKLENKDNIINKLENSQQTLLHEISELKQKLITHSVSPPASIVCQQEMRSDNDNLSLKSKDMKKSDSLNGSLSSIPNNENLNTNEIFICSLIDKIGQLEQRIIALELENQITIKRHKIEKMYRDCYEEYITRKGDELPKLESGKHSRLLKVDNIELSDNDQFITEFYEKKFQLLNKQLYDAIGKAALYFDEAKSMVGRLEIEQKESNALRDEIESAKQKIILTQEDLDLTRIQYENKMKDMSIHIAELNTQVGSRKINSNKTQMYGGDGITSGNDNLSSIKGFINSLKK